MIKPSKVAFVNVEKILLIRLDMLAVFEDLITTLKIILECYITMVAHLCLFCNDIHHLFHLQLFFYSKIYICNMNYSQKLPL